MLTQWCHTSCIPDTAQGQKVSTLCKGLAQGSLDPGPPPEIHHTSSSTWDPSTSKDRDDHTRPSVKHSFPKKGGGMRLLGLSLSMGLWWINRYHLYHAKNTRQSFIYYRRSSSLCCGYQIQQLVHVDCWFTERARMTSTVMTVYTIHTL